MRNLTLTLKYGFYNMFYARIAVSYWINRLVDYLIQIADYYVIERHVTLSETFLFMIFFFRAIWITLFGIQFGNTIAPFQPIWVPIFWSLSLVHIAALLLRKFRMRIAVLIAYSVVWGFIGTLLTMVDPRATSIPNAFLFSLLSLFIMIRLLKEARSMQG